MGLQTTEGDCSRDSVLCLHILGSLGGTVIGVGGGWLIVVSCYIFTTALSSCRYSDLWLYLSSYLNFSWPIHRASLYCQHLLCASTTLV